MKFNNETILSKNFKKAKKYFIDLNIELIKQVESKELKVNNEKDYIEKRKEQIENYKNMNETNNFTLLQRAYFYQTGKTIGFFK